MFSRKEGERKSESEKEREKERKKEREEGRNKERKKEIKRGRWGVRKMVSRLSLSAFGSFQARGGFAKFGITRNLNMLRYQGSTNDTQNHFCMEKPPLAGSLDREMSPKGVTSLRP